MNVAAIIAGSVLSVILAVLAFKLIVIKLGLREVEEQLQRLVHGGTNKLITVSGGDASVKKLASGLNTQLSALREKELIYVDGDKEVKTALANAAHDLRTPLTAISGYLDLLENETDEEKRERYLAVIRERTAALSKLSGELFSYSVAADNFRKKCLEPYDAGLVLKECIADYYEAFCTRNITPEIDVAVPSFIIKADKTELMRMFSNIISNALKYAAGGFKVGLENKKITFGNYVEGVDSIDVNRLFDRFYTVRNGSASTGLGLSITKIICERLGGKVSASLDNNYLEISLQF